MFAPPAVLLEVDEVDEIDPDSTPVVPGTPGEADGLDEDPDDKVPAGIAGSTPGSTDGSEEFAAASNLAWRAFAAA